jgi:hypothetical protein
MRIRIEHLLRELLHTPEHQSRPHRQGLSRRRTAHPAFERLSFINRQHGGTGRPSRIGVSLLVTSTTDDRNLFHESLTQDSSEASPQTDEEQSCSLR